MGTIYNLTQPVMQCSRPTDEQYAHTVAAVTCRLDSGGRGNYEYIVYVIPGDYAGLGGSAPELFMHRTRRFSTAEALLQEVPASLHELRATFRRII